MKLLILIVCISSAALATENDSLRQFMIHTNQSPKKDNANVWDVIMLRGADGQLQSWSEQMRGRVSDSAVCSDCQKIARYIAIAVKEGEKLEQFKSTLKLLCDLLDTQEQASCRNIIDNLDVILAKLGPLLDDPLEFCKELSLCAADNVPYVVRMAVRWLAARTDGTVRANDVVCDECQFVVNQLRAIMGEKSTQDQVRQVFDGVCQYLGGTTAQKCVQIIDQYFPLIWDELVALMADSRGLCIDLELCQNRAVHRTREHRTSMLRLVPAVVRRVAARADHLPRRQTPRLDSSIRFLRRIQTRSGQNAGCALCKMGWTALLAALKEDKDMQQKLSDAARNLVCNKILPSAYKLDCNDWLGLYLPPILYMTLEDIDPTQVCNMLGMCTKQSVDELNALSPAERVTVLCQACTVTAEFLQHEIADRSMQDDIIHTAESGCEDLPSDMQQECKALVDTYAPALFQTLQQELNPEVACPALHMCPPVSSEEKEQKVDTDDV